MEEVKIEVGMYVRTKRGIARVKTLCDLDNVAWTDKKGIFFGITRPTGKIDFILYDDGTVIGKPSFNILDVIEKGDYVNGCEVGYIDDCEGCMKEYYYIHEDPNVDSGHWKEEVKTVLTKEQFETMAYSMVEGE